jgi:branched-chain amino acid transport system ATP-binding protein
LLRIDGIRVAYRKVPVIHGLSLEVKQGELVAVVGANGAGKTTILKTVIGELAPTAGRIVFKGEDITSSRTAERVGRGIVYIPEARRVFGPLTVEENLRLGAYTVRDRARVAGSLARVYALFPRLAERRRQRAGTLSGGEQQMVAIGRGLMSDPELIMFDEPSIGLMPKLVAEVLDTIDRLRRHGTTILLVEQKVREALEIADRGYVLQTGQIVREGTGGGILDDDIVRRAFLGL